LQTAARKTVEFSRGEVDTEHLLLALLDSEVVRTILGQFKVSVDDLRRQIEQEAPHGKTKMEEGGEIGVTRGSRARWGMPSRSRASLVIPMSGPSIS
jgi:ATP-dependent Clp protease ATP-binding subunit ClpC